MRRSLHCLTALVAMFLLTGCDGALSTKQSEVCANAQKLASSVALIRLDPQFMWGPKGTLWFVSAGRPGQFGVTNAHVVKNLGLSTKWQEVHIYPATLSGKAITVPARIVLYRTEVGSVANNLADQTPLLDDDMAVVEFRHAVAGMEGLPVRPGPPRPGEEVRVLGYPGGNLRYGRGSILDELSPGIAHMHLQTKEGHWFGPGSSGSPIVDCKGNVVVVLSLYSGEFDNGGVLAERLVSFLQTLER